MYLPVHPILLVLLNLSFSFAYFSPGWTPGAATTVTGALPTESSKVGLKAFDWTALVAEGPIADLFNLVGVNVTEKLEAAKRTTEETPWDVRVPMITDENFEGIKEHAEESDVWFIIISLGSTRDPISKIVDEAYDKAFDTSLHAKDRGLEDIKWGRIDYMNVTRVTTGWMVWKAPVLVLAQNRFTSLRFLYPNQVSLTPENMVKFLANPTEWEDVPVWESPFSPGGTMEPYAEALGVVLEKVYNVLSQVPKWLMLLVTGALASVLIQAMHSWGGETKSKIKKTEEANGKEARPKRYVVKNAGDIVSPESAKPGSRPTPPPAYTTVSPKSKATSKRKKGLGASWVPLDKAGESMSASMLSEGTSGVSESEGGRPKGERRRSSRRKVGK